MCTTPPCEVDVVIFLFNSVGARPGEVKWPTPGLTIGQKGSWAFTGSGVLPWSIVFSKEQKDQKEAEPSVAPASTPSPTLAGAFGRGFHS